MLFRTHVIVGSIALALLCNLAWCAPLQAETVRKSGSLTIGYSAQVFFNVDPRDVIGLTKVWASLADRNLKQSGDTSVVIFKTLAEAEKALEHNEVDILVMIPEEFISLRTRIPLTPVLSADYGKNFYDELFLVVRKDSGITRISQLRGKSLRVETGQKGSVPLQWLDQIILSRTSSGAKGLFSNISEIPKASQVLMPVFFKQCDACLVSQTSFDVMSELNPQIGRQLQVLEKSPGFVTGILAVRKDVRNPRRDAMVEILQDMHNDPKGKQLLTLFRINRLVPFRHEHLAAAEKVIRDHRNKTERAVLKKYWFFSRICGLLAITETPPF
ncbi:MAG: PhnD/SsuA/transferrin family substrate-binding protein, partial [Desulfuromonadales bacterium]|nr:PhnD/SsuA/transferrin family substrate-binding protein [Desulfuromonadales bacterium]